MLTSDRHFNGCFMRFTFCIFKISVYRLCSIDDRITSEFEGIGGITIGNGNQTTRK
jgi:hypothetical protein